DASRSLQCLLMDLPLCLGRLRRTERGHKIRNPMNWPSLPFNGRSTWKNIRVRQEGLIPTVYWMQTYIVSVCLMHITPKLPTERIQSHYLSTRHPSSPIQLSQAPGPHFWAMALSCQCYLRL